MLKNRHIKKQQLITLGVLLGSAVLLVILIYCFTSSSSQKKVAEKIAFKKLI
ncbi:MAG: hypothetical protein LRY69_01960 [Gammaproteobacteria bacterium]|nr:hypothetical protein [Gammaproteobacteria bacterium]